MCKPSPIARQHDINWHPLRHGLWPVQNHFQQIVQRVYTLSLSVSSQNSIRVRPPCSELDLEWDKLLVITKLSASA